MAIRLIGKATSVYAPYPQANVSVPLPTGTRPGHLMLLFIGYSHTQQNAVRLPQTPTGWTLIRSTSYNPATYPTDEGVVLAAYWKVNAGETEIALRSYSALTDVNAYSILVYSGQDATTPIDVEGHQTNDPAAVSGVAPSVTTTVARTRLVVAYQLSNSGSGSALTVCTAPAGMTEQTDFNGAYWYALSGELAVNDQALTVAGATGTRTSAFSSGSWMNLAEVVAIRSDQSNPHAILGGITVKVYCGIPSFSVDGAESSVDEILNDPDGALVRVVGRLQPRGLDGSVLAPRWFSNIGKDMPISGYQRELLGEDAQVTRSILGSGQLGGAASVSLGDISIANADGQQDDLASAALDGWDAELWIGGTSRRGRELDWSDYLRFTHAKMGAQSASLTDVSIPLEDGTAAFERQVQPHRYPAAPDDALDELKALQGQPIPVCLGKVLNGEPRLISRVPLVYQFHDGANFSPARSLDAVYDSRVVLPTDFYTANLAAGTFTLNVNPAGRITFDAHGPEEAGDIAAHFLRWLLTDYGTGPLVWPNEVAPDYFLAYEAGAPEQLGFYLAEDATIAEVATQVVAPLDFWGLSRLHAAIMGEVQVPFGAPDLEVGEHQIASISKRPADRPFSRVGIGYAKNWTVQDSGEIAGSVAQSADGLFARDEFRQVYSPEAGPDADVIAAFPHAEEQEFVPTLMTEKADAVAKAATLYQVYGKPWDIFDVDTDIRALKLDLNKQVLLTHPRFGLAAGRLLRVLGMAEGMKGVKLTLWGLPLPSLLTFPDGAIMSFDDDVAVRA